MTGPVQQLSPADARSMLMSLRDGTVPEKGIELLTVGRSGWLRSFERDLEDVASGIKQVRLINGRYGDGKTHLMAMLREMGLRNGFVVSFVTIKSEVPLSRWDLLYKAVVIGLESNQRRGPQGLAALITNDNPDPQIAAQFTQKARSVRSLTSSDSSFVKAVYGYATGQAQSFIDPDEDMRIFRSWLEGNVLPADARRPLGLQANIDRTNASRMFRALVAVLRHFGYPGLLLLLDEVESTLDQRLNVRSAAYDNLRSLVDRRDLPDGCFVVCSVTPPMFTDEVRGIRSYEALWQRLRPVTDREGVNYESTVVELERDPLTANDFRTVGENIRAVHAVANGWQAERRVTDAFLTAAGETAARARSLPVAATRILVKVVTDELDRAYRDEGYVPEPRRLPLMFDRVAQELSEARPVNEWPSS